MALHIAGIAVQTREIVLKNKPAHMLQVSPKGTVPVLVLADGRVIDESLDIMQWALQQHDPAQWLGGDKRQAESIALIAQNDSKFKQALDRYKYAIRFPEQPPEVYRGQGETFLQQLETQLQQQSYLLSDSVSLADVAIFPFVRQFSMVDPAWFAQAPYPAVRAWLQQWLVSETFTSIMHQYPVYQDEARP